jgi:N-acetylneuraminate lyase
VFIEDIRWYTRSHINIRYFRIRIGLAGLEIILSRNGLTNLKGVIPALITPFDINQDINEAGLRQLIDHLIDKGINGVYTTGSTGEGFLMSPEERKRVVAIVVDQVAGRIPVMVHIGAIGTRVSIDLAQHAEETGADVISSVPPFYWKFSDDSIFKYYKEITESVNLPMVVYNIPLAGLVGYDQIKRFSDIDGVEGIKFTATTHFEIMRMKKEIGSDFMIYSGCDEMSISGLTFGADGLIGSFYNLMPEVFLRIYHAMQAGDYNIAEQQQAIANNIIVNCTAGNYVGIMKRALSWMGIDAGYCRSPFINVEPAEEAGLKEMFRKIRSDYNISDIDFLNFVD